jgi:hypothetical protein
VRILVKAMISKIEAQCRISRICSSLDVYGFIIATNARLFKQSTLLLITAAQEHHTSHAPRFTGTISCSARLNDFQKRISAVVCYFPDISPACTWPVQLAELSHCIELWMSVTTRVDGVHCSNSCCWSKTRCPCYLT